MDNQRIVFSDIKVDFSSKTPEEIFGPSVSPRSIKLYEKYLPIVEKIGHPKAIVKFVDTEVLDDETAIVGGHTFKSALLANKLKNQHKAIVIVATAGPEVKETEEIQSGAVKDVFAGVLLGVAVGHAFNYLKENFDLGEGGLLQPGSLPDWPIINNIALTDVIGGVGDIGITLTDNGYMNPWNSLSGIFFMQAGGYRNCMLCLKQNCISRGAPFNKEEYQKVFGKQV